MNCCDDPKPRVAERNGKFFCANCRRWMSGPSEPLSDESSEERDDDAADEEGDPS